MVDISKKTNEKQIKQIRFMDDCKIREIESLFS